MVEEVEEILEAVRELEVGVEVEEGSEGEEEGLYLIVPD